MLTTVKPISWSFTALEHFKQCARAYHEIRVLKNFKEEEGEALLWGNRVHHAIAEALTKNVPMPQGMELWQPLVEQFRGLKGTLYVEQQLALTEGFQPCAWKDWNNAWVRGVIDALWIDGTVAKAVDWKTGRRKPNSDQLTLFALLVFHHYPEVQEVRTMFVWLKTCQQDQKKYTRNEIPALWNLFIPDLHRLKNAFTVESWPATTSGLCRMHCPVITCNFNGNAHLSRGVTHGSVGEK